MLCRDQGKRKRGYTMRNGRATDSKHLWFPSSWQTPGNADQRLQRGSEPPYTRMEVLRSITLSRERVHPPDMGAWTCQKETGALLLCVMH